MPPVPGLRRGGHVRTAARQRQRAGVRLPQRRTGRRPFVQLGGPTAQWSRLLEYRRRCLPEAGCHLRPVPRPGRSHHTGRGQPTIRLPTRVGEPVELSARTTTPSSHCHRNQRRDEHQSDGAGTQHPHDGAGRLVGVLVRRRGSSDRGIGVSEWASWIGWTTCSRALPRRCRCH